MENKEDIISVIVCTYNQEDTIGRTLDSILSQRCHLPVEIVIGEDGSTDGTLAVCQAYREKHPDKIRILARQTNRGFVSNYFDCLRACRGKYVADCAGDDFWTDETKLEQQSAILEKNADVGIVHTDWLRYDVQTGALTAPHGDSSQCPTINGQRSMVNGQCSLVSILTPASRPAIHLCTALYRNEWVLQAMQEYPRFFDPEAYRCEDIQIAFFLARRGKVAYIDHPTLAYSWGGESISNPQDEEKQFRFWANMTRLSFDLADAFSIADRQLDTFLQRRIHKLLMHAFRSGNPDLRKEALRMQREMHIADNRQTLLAKFLMLPGVWTVMRHVRNAVKANKIST